MELRKKIDKILANALIVIMGVMVINVLWQVFTRFIVGTPSSFTDELARYLMIWLGILGAAYVSGRNMHVAIDVLPLRSSSKTQKKLKLIVYSLIIVFAFLQVYPKILLLSGSNSSDCFLMEEVSIVATNSFSDSCAIRITALLLCVITDCSTG